MHEPAHWRESSMEILQKPADHISVVVDGAGPQGERESLDMRFKDLLEGDFGLAHKMGGEEKRVRFWMAREYSFHTSWGASWT